MATLTKKQKLVAEKVDSEKLYTFDEALEVLREFEKNTKFDETVELAKKDGCVRTWMGRRRNLPDLTSRNRVLRQAAERMATNTVIQGTAADLIKKAMVDVDRILESNKIDATMILQVHDELVFETGEESRADLSAMVREKMERVAKLEVPLTVDLGAGENWRVAH